MSWGICSAMAVRARSSCEVLDALLDSRLDSLLVSLIGNYCSDRTGQPMCMHGTLQTMGESAKNGFST